MRASAPSGTENESKRTSFRPDDEGNTRIEEERSAYEQRQHKKELFYMKGYTCTECDRDFVYNNELHDHLELAHGHLDRTMRLQQQAESELDRLSRDAEALITRIDAPSRKDVTAKQQHPE